MFFIFGSPISIVNFSEKIAVNFAPKPCTPAVNLELSLYVDDVSKLPNINSGIYIYILDE